MPASSQEFLEIQQIREGVIVLKNKALRGIMMISSLNLALKSPEEQEAVIYQFQDFINSLDFFLQIVIQSRKLNITGYLEKIKKLEKNQPSDLLKLQTASYHDFIEGLVEKGSIMTKNFFIVVPFTIFEIQAGYEKKNQSFASKIPLMSEEQFQRCKSQLWQRMEFLALGLQRMGLQAVPLSTGELIEFFWALHHPQEAEIGYYPEVPPELSK